jgi:hypothetical protein
VQTDSSSSFQSYQIEDVNDDDTCASNTKRDKKFIGNYYVFTSHPVGKVSFGDASSGSASSSNERILSSTYPVVDDVINSRVKVLGELFIHICMCRWVYTYM